MLDLDDQSRDLLKRWADAATPTEPRLLGVQAAVRRRLLAGDPGLVPTAGSVVGAKAILAGVVALGIAAGAIAMAFSGSDDARESKRGVVVSAEPEPESSPPPPTPESPSPAEQVATPHAAAATSESTRPTSEPSDASKPRSEPKRTRTMSSPKPRSQPAGIDDLQAELRLFRAARAAAAKANHAKAVDLLEQHARRFPDGVLWGEREVARAESECALGRRAVARRRVAAFLRAAPGSPLRGRARNVCS